ncbi:MAG: hypothetical protein QXY39_03745 [Thermofilaceae archaeon]
MAEPGEVYYSLSPLGNFYKIGIAEVIDIGGEVPYELSENLSILDSSGFGRVFVNVMSPKHEAVLRIRYIRDQNESFHNMINKITKMHKDFIQGRHSLMSAVYIQLVLSQPIGNRQECLFFVSYPSRFSWRIDAGQINMIHIEITLPLINRDNINSLQIDRCYNLISQW